MAKQPKHYVVWRGRTPGIYDTWAQCEAQVKGVEGAMYKAFATRAEAEAAAQDDPWKHMGNKGHLKKTAPATTAAPGTTPALPPSLQGEAIAVDAACSGNPGKMEYRGVHLPSGRQLFHFGPIWGTNNIGEFLAIVHALALLDKTGQRMTIYSDSRNALSWVRRKQCKTQLAVTERSREVHNMIARAEAWLQAHRLNCPLVKWETQDWGEIPADFGRKG